MLSRWWVKKVGELIPSGDFQHIRNMRRLGDQIPVFAHAVQVDFEGFVHPPARLFERLPRRDAARKVRRIGTIACSGGFINDSVSIHFNPACFTMLLSVPGATSSEG